MTGSEAIAFIQQVCWRGSKPGLERVTALLEAMGRPDRQLRYVHIAGTNGKGSTAAMTASILHAAGYRVGLYTSPYLQRFHERMRIDSEPISDGELGEVVEAIAPLARAMDDRPTEFELTTCAALAWFARRRCDIVVLEVGMGGRLDATNVVERPEVSVITAIGLDHTEQLGDTLPLIAAEKAGILKPGVPAVLYQAPQEVDCVVARLCRERSCPLTRTRLGDILVHDDTIQGQRFDYPPFRNLALSLLGGHQRSNAAVVLETVLQLRRCGWSIPDSAVYDGLALARWPGRFEILGRQPLFIADGGHNPQCAQALAANLAWYFPGRGIHFLVGMLADKDWRTVMDTIAPLAASFTTVPPDNPRALEAGALGAYLKRFGVPVSVCPTAEAGLEQVLHTAGSDGVVCSFGSLYLTGQIRTLFLG